MEFVKTWDCISDVYREHGFNPSHIVACCKGEGRKDSRRKSVGGYIWRYHHNQDEQKG